MNPSNSPQPNKEDIQAENDFIKMKLMLEKGAIFGSNAPEGEQDPEMENKFLNYILAMEAQMESDETIPIRQFLGFPQQFRPVSEIPEDGFDQAWQEADDLLSMNRIQLSVFNDAVTTKQLYTFFYEEFLDMEIDAIDVPGCVYCYNYDSMKPDPYFECPEHARSCIGDILDRDRMEFGVCSWMPRIRLNEHEGLNTAEMIAKVKSFFSAFDSIEVTGLEQQTCTVEGQRAEVKGIYGVVLKKDGVVKEVNGNWRIIFESSDFMFDWEGMEVDLEGLAF